MNKQSVMRIQKEC